MLKALSQMEQGHIGTVLRIRGKPELHRRLLKAGVTVGVTTKRCVGASLNDLVEIGSNHSRIMLDQKATDCIYVDPE